MSIITAIYGRNDEIEELKQQLRCKDQIITQKDRKINELEEYILKFQFACDTCEINQNNKHFIEDNTRLKKETCDMKRQLKEADNRIKEIQTILLEERREYRSQLLSQTLDGKKVKKLEKIIDELTAENEKLKKQLKKKIKSEYSYSADAYLKDIAYAYHDAQHQYDF